MGRWGLLSRNKLRRLLTNVLPRFTAPPSGPTCSIRIIVDVACGTISAMQACGHSIFNRCGSRSTRPEWRLYASTVHQLRSSSDLSEDPHSITKCAITRQKPTSLLLLESLVYSSSLAHFDSRYRAEMVPLLSTSEFCHTTDCQAVLNTTATFHPF